VRGLATDPSANWNPLIFEVLWITAMQTRGDGRWSQWRKRRGLLGGKRGEEEKNDRKWKGRSGTAEG